MPIESTAGERVKNWETWSVGRCAKIKNDSSELYQLFWLVWVSLQLKHTADLSELEA